MSILKIRKPEEIIKEAIKVLDASNNYNFSDFVNELERKAHVIYLREEQKAIEDFILEKFGKTSILRDIIKDLAKTIATLSTVIANTRRARGGKSSEYILSYALKYYANIDNELVGGRRSDGSYYPDIAIPSAKLLKEKPHKAIALAVKRTLRERWREDIALFSHFPNAAFVCISESTDITEKKLSDMEKEGIKVLFLPDKKFSQIKLKVSEMKIYKLSDLPLWIRKRLNL